MREPLDETLPVPSSAVRGMRCEESGGAPSASPPVSRVGRYELLGELGAGGMGQVFEAWDPELRRRVAVKLVRTSDRQSGGRLARFVAEAQITSQLQHPNIVPVHDMGVSEEGLVYFVMKKVEGDSLHDVISRLRAGDRLMRDRWSRPRLLRVFVQVAQAVAYAHQRGVLHRDLKPANIMLGAFGEVLLMDWGLAGQISHPVVDTPAEPIEATERGDTAAGSALGTPGYMAPEQAEGVLTLVDERSDVWSLGAILFELLVWRRAFDGTREVFELGSGYRSVPDPREADPRRSTPDEIARICVRALAPRRSERFLTVASLVEAVEAFLEGSKRREEADRRLERARNYWDRHQELDRERRHLTDQRRQLESVTEPWAPLEDRYKAELLQVRRRLVDLDGELAAAFGGAVSAAEHALAAEPGHADARDLLASAWWLRFEEAERRHDAAEAAFCRARVGDYDVGRYAARLSVEGALTLRTDPPGAEVMCWEVDRKGLIWTRSTVRELGPTPLERTALPKGSYLLRLRAPGRTDVTYPVHIDRGGEWDSGSEPVRLPRAGVIPDGFVYVPEGPFGAGGDPESGRQLAEGRPNVPAFAISAHPVTVAEYLEYLNDLYAKDPAQAAARAPRRSPGAHDPSLLGRPLADRGYVLPKSDEDGHRWLPTWPVCSISWHDALAYVRWRGIRDGLALDLPSELQWEKAARGVDGRLFPWGNEFDPTLCKMAQSRRGQPVPEPVGSFPRDRSVYGVMDMAGCIREWCADRGFEDNEELRPVRGGAWSGTQRVCRLANRYGYTPASVHTYLGFRLVAKVVA